MLPLGPGGCGAYRSFLMKLFTGSLAAGLVLLAGGAQAQAPGRYVAASDFDAPYAVAPPPVLGPQYMPGPRYAPGPQHEYGAGPGLLPSTEVYSVLRDNGFSPLGIPRLRGFIYTIAVIDRGGEDGRLIIDARNGRIIRFVPAYGYGPYGRGRYEEGPYGQGPYRRGPYGQPHGHRVDDAHQRLGDPDGGDGIGPQPGHEEDVDDGEDALQHHLQHHRHGEDEDRRA